MLYTTVGLAVTIDETFFTIIVVFYPTTSRACEFQLELALHSLKTTLPCILLFDLKACSFDFSHKFFKILLMELQGLVSSHEVLR